MGKIYDYLRVGRPVLAVAYEGEAQALIEEGQLGSVVKPEDTDAIKLALKTLIQRSTVTGNLYSVPSQFVEQFRYERLAGKLAEVLDRTVSHDR